MANSLVEMALITYRGECVRMDFSVFSVSEDGKTLRLRQGDEVVAEAYRTGSLMYFAKHKLYGFRVCLFTANARFKFWWLFANPEIPGRGQVRPLHWHSRQKYMARISVADYVTTGMSAMLEERIGDDPAFLQTPRDELLAQLMMMFVTLYGASEHVSVRSIMPQYGHLPDAEGGAKPRLGLCTQTVQFEDDSCMRVSPSGYRVVEMVPYYDDKYAFRQ